VRMRVRDRHKVHVPSAEIGMPFSRAVLPGDVCVNE
jgi:hypothetical protein